MEYGRKDLESKSIDELKNILKNVGFKTSGNKQDLIGRILENQSNYLDLLPSDINKMIYKYQIENDVNRKILEYLLFNTHTMMVYLAYQLPHIMKKREEINTLFKNYNLDIQIVPRKTAVSVDSKNSWFDRGETLFIIDWGNVGLVPDEVIINLLPIFAVDEQKDVNEKLEELGSKFRVVKDKDKYIVEEIKAK